MLCAMFIMHHVNGSTQASIADQYIQSLKLRASIVEKQFGEHMSDPAFLGRMLIDTPVNDLMHRQEVIFNGLRLPSLEKFEQDILGWANSAMPTVTRKGVSMSIAKGVLDGVEALVSMVSILLKQSATSYTDLQTNDSETDLVTNDGGLLTIISISGVVGLVGDEEYKRIHEQLLQTFNSPLKNLGHDLSVHFGYNP